MTCLSSVHQSFPVTVQLPGPASKSSQKYAVLPGGTLQPTMVVHVPLSQICPCPQALSH